MPSTRRHHPWTKNDLDDDFFALNSLKRLDRDSAKVFRFQPTSLLEAVRDAIVVTDTNGLLVPYGIGKEPCAHPKDLR